MKKIFVSFAVLALLLAACGGANNNNTVSTTPEQPTDPNMGEPNTGAPDDSVTDPGLPDAPAEIPNPIVNLPGETPFQEQPPAPGQATWSEGNAFVNSVDLVIMESYPIQVGMYIEGELPTPCNHLTIDIAAPDADNNIHVRVYSLINPAEMCIQVIEPFSQNVSLPTADLADGTYSVFVNGELVGTFTYPGG